MSELNKQTEPSDPSSASSSGIARRRMILASLGKGASVAAAVAVPMNSLAAFGTLSITAAVDGKGRRCTVSGTMSKPHSTETTIAVCKGWSPSYYSNPSNWPANPGFTTTSKFNEVFVDGSSTYTLLEILQGVQGTSSAEASWIAAVLNGTSGSLAEENDFPYTAVQVKEFYNAGDPTRSSALAFFQGYMETGTI